VGRSRGPDLAVREITRFDPAPFRSRIAAEIPDFRPQDHLAAKRAKRLDRFSQLGVTSARRTHGCRARPDA